jgi:HPt (histidine-containing phosphotransfer) domain-containing protein
MQYRCHDCGELFESSHTNYKFARGFHPDDNPNHSAIVARDFDHCENCRHLRNHDPVAARTRDLAASSGSLHSPALQALNAEVEKLRAQVENSKNERAVAQALHGQITELQKTLGMVPSKSLEDAVARARAAHV